MKIFFLQKIYFILPIIFTIFFDFKLKLFIDLLIHHVSVYYILILLDHILLFIEFLENLANIVQSIPKSKACSIHHYYTKKCFNFILSRNISISNLNSKYLYKNLKKKMKITVVMVTVAK